MTKDVIELAREAGFPFNKYGLLQGDSDGEIEADAMFASFAALVAERERERIAEMARCTVWAGREFADRIRALNTEGDGHDRP